MIPDKLTPLSHGDLIRALRGGCLLKWKREPIAMELATYYAQCLEENGAQLQALHNNCLGNVKAGPKWTGETAQYACDETVANMTEAARVRAMAAPELCELHPQTNGKIRLVLYPPHPWTEFRAFETATEGAAAYLDLFTWTRYAQAALRARAGDPVGFVLACKAAGYFTAPDVHAYASAVASIASHALVACEAELTRGAADGLPPGEVIDDATREHVEGLVALNLAEFTWSENDADTERPGQS